MLQELRRTLRSEGMVAQPIKTRAPYLRSFGFAPEVVFDVGVADGTPWLYRSFPDARFVLIDPQGDCANSVREKGHLDEFHFHAAALGAREGEAELSIPIAEKGRQPAMASLKKRTDKLAKSFVRTESVHVPVKTLDQIAIAYPGRCGIKLDIEGSELDALKGATNTLERCDFAILKLSVMARFEGVGVPSEVAALLGASGLELRDVLSVGAGPGKKSHPRYLDVLYTRWAE